MMKKIVAAILMAAFAISVAAPVAAGSLSVEPLFVEIKPGSSGAVRVRNSSDKPISVELTVTEREVSESGVQTRKDAEDAFVLFPPQGVIQPNGVQVFRIQPIAPDPAKSRSYFVSVRQIPVDLGLIEGGGAQIQVVFAFDVAAHTVPNGSKSDPQFVSAALATTEVEKQPATDNAPAPAAPAGTKPKPEMETVPAVAITLRNDGNKYFYLHELDYQAVGTDEAGNKVEIPAWDENAIIDAARVSLVPPGAVRTFKVPLRNLPSLKAIDVRIRKRSLR
jgi:fimbrial chaperone protein